MGLRVEYTFMPSVRLLESSRVLAVLEFAADCADLATDPRHLVTGLPSLAGDGMREVWRSARPVHAGRDSAVQWASDGETLFVATTANASPCRELGAVAHGAWCQVLRFSRDAGFPHVVRAWNHVPRINDGDGDAERYRLFCAGRSQALADHGYDSRSYSAASAVGNVGDALVIYLLASREPGRHVENPRQLSAYAYPRRYGPRPPSFARATAKHWGDTCHLYISGTASILGHRSTALGDVAGQLSVTLGNIDRLLSAADVDGQPDAMRVYVRDPATLEPIMVAVGEYAPTASVAYLRADICRAELALEIEGIVRIPRA